MFKQLILLTALFSTPIIVTANVELDMASLVDDLMSEDTLLKKRVNDSGRQRMLTQQISKLALLISLHNENEVYAKDIVKYSNLFSSSLEVFKTTQNSFSFSKETSNKILEQISTIEKLWKPFYSKISILNKNSKEKDEALEYIIKNDEKLLEESNRLVHMYENANKKSNYMEKAMISIVNLAGRQRMLTQKMTKEKLLLSQGDNRYKGELEKSIELFDSSLTSLIKGNKRLKITKPTNQKIIKQLSKVDRLWKMLKPLYQKNKNSKKELNIIIEQNEVLLKEMNNVVKLVEEESEY